MELKQVQHDKSVINRYNDHQFVINEQVYHQTVMVSPQVVVPCACQSVEAMTQADLQALLDLKPHIILFGTGLHVKKIPKALRQTCAAHHIGIEVMTTPSACSTFNLLSWEERPVAALIFLNKPL